MRVCDDESMGHLPADCGFFSRVGWIAPERLVGRGGGPLNGGGLGQAGEMMGEVTSKLPSSGLTLFMK